MAAVEQQVALGHVCTSSRPNPAPCCWLGDFAAAARGVKCAEYTHDGKYGGVPMCFIWNYC